MSGLFFFRVCSVLAAWIGPPAIPIFAVVCVTETRTNVGFGQELPADLDGFADAVDRDGGRGQHETAEGWFCGFAAGPPDRMEPPPPV